MPQALAMLIVYSRAREARNSGALGVLACAVLAASVVGCRGRPTAVAPTPCPASATSLTVAVALETSARSARLDLARVGRLAVFPGVASPPFDVERIELRLKSHEPVRAMWAPGWSCGSGSCVRPGPHANSGALRDLGLIRDTEPLALTSPLQAGRLYLVPDGASGRPWKVEGDVTISAHLGPPTCAAISAQTIGLHPSEPACGDGWTEAPERCDSGSESTSLCQNCALAPPRCSDGHLEVVRCEGSPSRCARVVCRPGEPDCPATVEVAVGLRPDGRTLRGAVSPARVVSDAGHRCGCELGDSSWTCGPECSRVVPTCSAIEFALELQPGESVTRWLGCSPADGRCRTDALARDKQVDLVLDGGTSSGVGWIDTRPGPVEQVLLARGASVVVASTRSVAVPTAPAVGGVVFERRARIAALADNGQLRWQIDLRAAGRHVSPIGAAATGDGGAVIAALFPSGSPTLDTPASAPARRVRLARFSREGSHAWTYSPRRSGELRFAVGEDGSVGWIVTWQTDTSAGIESGVLEPGGRDRVRHEHPFSQKDARLVPLDVRVSPMGVTAVGLSHRAFAEVSDSEGPTPVVVNILEDGTLAARRIELGVRPELAAARLAPDGSSWWSTGRTRLELRRIDGSGALQTTLALESRCRDERIATAHDGGVIVASGGCPDAVLRVWRFDAAGQPLFAERYAGDPEALTLHSVAAEPSGGIVLAGSFSRSLELDPRRPGRLRLDLPVSAANAAQFVIRMLPPPDPQPKRSP